MVDANFQFSIPIAIGINSQLNLCITQVITLI